MPVPNRHIRLLKPYLIGDRPKSNGEWDMRCPLHEDVKRSASLNVLSGDWFCFANCGGGSVIDLIRQKSRWVPPAVAGHNGHGGGANGRVMEAPTENITMGMIKGWNKNLMEDEVLLDYVTSVRGLYTATVARFDIGYDHERRCYTIPVYGPDGEIWNVRRYDPVARATKIWSVKGMRVTELYPIGQLEADELVFCEGEWDTLRTIQEGYAAITRTTGVNNNWNHSWNELFKGKTLYLGSDADLGGQTGNRKIARALSRLADVRIVQLPYPIAPKHGKDLTDFWNEHDRAAFEDMLAKAEPWNAKRDDKIEKVSVLDSFDSAKIGKPVRLQVTIKGKKEPGYSVPRKVQLTCTRDAGHKCNICPLNGAGGEATWEIEPNNPDLLAMIDSSHLQLSAQIASAYGVPGGKCIKLEQEVQEYQSVEILFARPSVDRPTGEKITSADYKSITITSVGRHDTSPNNTVTVTGARHPSPRDQTNSFLAWDIERQETSVDRFEMSPDVRKVLKRFQPRRGQRPIAKLGNINRELSQHVTRIVARPEMHALMDLTFHSILSFKFGGQLVHRGWLESLVVGDTRTGKSEAAERLVRHFAAGEVVGGEAATLAGLVGGVQQVGGKDWTITWGVIPLNDRRIVVIDELSGLHPDDIAKMSDVRASGMARITKVVQEVTFARTRLLWLGNPRNGGMDQFTYGVDAIRPLIGNPEDIARFDLAMSLSKSDVPAQEFNKPIPPGELKYTSEACHLMLMWCWTRQPEQIVWQKGSEDEVYKQAMKVGGMYVEDPPLVQAANIRIKIARTAVALAARMFSSDDGERVLVTKEHVQDAVKFMNMLYGMPNFGYEERSRERLADTAEAEENRELIRRYLLERRGLAKFLRSQARFRRQDLEEILNIDRDSANGIINKLWEARMVRKEGQDVRVEPTLHLLLREVRW